MNIGDVALGNNHRAFIIAEMSGNHNRSLERAMQIIDAAADAGADAVKLQTYTPDTMTMAGVFTIKDEKSLWKGRELYDLYQEAHTPWEWHQPLFEHAQKRGLLIFSTPFDETSVDFLQTLNVPAYKIASFENTHHPLLKKIAGTGKPVIMSTGVATIAEICESVEVLKNNGCKDLILLKCTSTYPATSENSNINTITALKEIFPTCIIGLSDHTMGMGAAIAAIALGARVIEKHFTLSRADGGVDSAFSLEPKELKMLVKESASAFLSLGKVQLGVLPAEKNSIMFKRSIYISKDLKPGDKIAVDNIKIIRPALGLQPKFYDIVIGKTVNKPIAAGTPLTWDLL